MRANITLKSFKQRGRPLHVQSERGTVSIVPEVAGTDLRIGGRRGLHLRLLRPQTAFVIDAHGVTPLELRGSIRYVLTALFAAVIVTAIRRVLALRRMTNDE